MQPTTWGLLTFPCSTVDNGSIVEQGTYAELSDEKGAFAALMVEFGGQRHEDKVEEIISDDVDDIAVPERVGLERRNTAAQSKAQAYDKSAAKLAAGTGKLEGRLVQQEKRNTGNIKSDVYKQYFTAGKGWLTIPLILASVLLTQGKVYLID
jgi:ATP-binding cassette subfamily C (CFTR/MRP) protein 1